MMKTLIVDDDPVSRLILESTLKKVGCRPVMAPSGAEAWRILNEPDPPYLIILDRLMPGLDGTELCRRIRSDARLGGAYIIMVTGMGEPRQIIEGLNAGANDYLSKPFDPRELSARVNVGLRMLQLERALAARVAELEEALAHVEMLQGLLPICFHCHRIRDDQETWHKLESYLALHAGTTFTHGLCPDCLEHHYPAGTPTPGLPIPG